MAKKLEEIQKKIAALRKEQNEIEEEEMAEKTVPLMRSLVGKTFVYRNNSYSCPKKQSDYWNVYRRILGVDDTSYPIFLIEELSIDSQGRAQVSTGEGFLYTKNFDEKQPWLGWVSCEMKEYEANRAEVFKEMLTLERLKKYLKTRND